MLELFEVRCNGTLRTGTSILTIALDYLLANIRGKVWITLNNEDANTLASILVTYPERAEIWQVRNVTHK